MVELKAVDLSHHLSDEAKSRSNSKLKDAFVHFSDPGIVSMAGGLPLPTLFPFDEISLTSIKPHAFAKGIDKPAESEEDKLSVNIKKFPTDEKVGYIPLKTSLQYGTSEGQIDLRKFITEHTNLIHHIPYSDWSVVCSVGNTHALDAILRTFTNRGDTILAEEFTFASAAEAIHSSGLKMVPVEMDLEGMVPEKLASLLDNWVGPKPKLLYTIPTGQNPTGSTLSNERREAIYKIAQKHDILIVEDEPYYFLQMPPYEADKAKRAARAEEEAKTMTHESYKKGLVKSFLNFDTDGRVVRLDSFSKVIAPGMRVGWIISNSLFGERLLRCLEVTVQAPSGFSQSVVHALLTSWGQDGYLDWLIELRKEYTNKRDAAQDALEKYFSKDVASFIAPTAGMFFWIKLDATKHKKYEQFKDNLDALEEEVYESFIRDGSQLVPGHWFKVHDETKAQNMPPSVGGPGLFFRGTFASVPADKLDVGLKRTAETVSKEFN